MSPRSGQNGTVVIQSGWCRVRWRMDVGVQNERANMSKKVAPVVLDKAGNPEPPSQEVRRLAVMDLPVVNPKRQRRAQRRECTPMTTRSFTLARLRRHREAFLNQRLPERCLAVDGPGRLIAVEVEI